MSPEGPALVRAGGGVVWRRGPRGLEVLLVHRPRYDDWSFPKGKADPGESDLQAALREVEEETGLRCAVAAELDPITYRDRNGRPKQVRYWLMEPVEGEFVANPEVDEVRWLTVQDAHEWLTYADERVLLGGAERSWSGEQGV